MDIQTFFDSLAGQLTVAGVIVILFAAILYSGKGKPTDTKALAISALLVALSLILNQLVIFRMPQGGSITVFSMVPIVLCAYFFGVRRGLLAGMCVGLISLIFNPYVIHPIQLLLDYPLAFGSLALGGIFAAKKNGLIKGYIFGIFCRYICSGRIQCIHMVYLVQFHVRCRGGSDICGSAVHTAGEAHVRASQGLARLTDHFLDITMSSVPSSIEMAAFLLSENSLLTPSGKSLVRM